MRDDPAYWTKDARDDLADAVYDYRAGIMPTDTLRGYVLSLFEPEDAREYMALVVSTDNLH